MVRYEGINMKQFGKLFFYLSTLAFVSSCGKDNKSGQSQNPYSYNNAYCATTVGCASSYYTAGQITAIASQHQVLNAAQAENPCVAGTYYGTSRITVQTQITMNSVVTAGDVFLGVTSYGDVAAVIGNGTRNPSVVAYICPRSSVSGQGSLSMPVLGAYSNCSVKPLTALNMYFPDGTQANFRDPQFGSSNKQRFSFCTQ